MGGSCVKVLFLGGHQNAHLISDWYKRKMSEFGVKHKLLSAQELRATVMSEGH